jgi:hypothetical protein
MNYFRHEPSPKKSLQDCFNHMKNPKSLAEFEPKTMKFTWLEVNELNHSAKGRLLTEKKDLGIQCTCKLSQLGKIQSKAFRLHFFFGGGGGGFYIAWQLYSITGGERPSVPLCE